MCRDLQPMRRLQLSQPRRVQIHRALESHLTGQILYGSGPTVCVTGAGAGVDNVREQKKTEARKMFENAAESPASSARCVGRFNFLLRLL
jgi:homoserine kinase